ncbi:MAG: hypothetical protein ACI9BW_003259 [Gammaproteobacteria bacterium]|jgi:uncharacterized protein
MKLDFEQQTTLLNITAYSAAGITVGGQHLADPFVVCGNELFVDILPSKVTDIRSSHIQKIVDLGQSIIIIGTGGTQIFLDAPVLQCAYSARIGVEVMSTAAACRSFNILVAENRAVVGAFYMP